MNLRDHVFIMNCCCFFNILVSNGFNFSDLARSSIIFFTMVIIKRTVS